MSITIDLRPDLEAQLREKALVSGCDVENYLEKLVEKELTGPTRLRDLYAPVRRQIKESGISEEELDTLLEEAREEAFQERMNGARNDE